SASTRLRGRINMLLFYSPERVMFDLSFPKCVRMSEDIRVAIVEDDGATREGLGLIVKSTPGYDCVGTYPSVEEDLRMPADARPDVLLLDINLPGMPGSEGVKLFLSKYPALRILML